MSWRPRDCHAHTTMSDGELGVAELVATVTGRGALPSVADHISRATRTSVDSVPAIFAISRRLELLAELKKLR